jgi:hypothetical protein
MITSARIRRTLDWLRDHGLLQPHKPKPPANSAANPKPSNVISIEEGRRRVERMRSAYRQVLRRAA